MRSSSAFSIIGALIFVTAASAAQAAEITVASPANEETIHSNQGRLTVKLRRVDAPPDAAVRLVLDGTAQPELHHGNVIELEGIVRGSHHLQAVLVGADGARLAASRPVTFFMWHASRLIHEHN